MEGGEKIVRWHELHISARVKKSPCAGSQSFVGTSASELMQSHSTWGILPRGLFTPSQCALPCIVRSLAMCTPLQCALPCTCRAAPCSTCLPWPGLRSPLCCSYARMRSLAGCSRTCGACCTRWFSTGLVGSSTVITMSQLFWRS